jgi:hypothetical protein
MSEVDTKKNIENNEPNVDDTQENEEEGMVLFCGQCMWCESAMRSQAISNALLTEEANTD